MKFNKNIFPEINELDFINNIEPLLNKLDDSISFSFNELLFSSISKKGSLNLREKEQYPYQNICKYIALSIINNDDDDKFWEKDIFVDSNSIREIVCDILSQTIFLYFIRSFSQQIKKVKKPEEDSEAVYLRYIDLLYSSDFKVFYDEYPILWYRTMNLLKNKLFSIKESVLLTQKHRVEIEQQLNIPKEIRIKSLMIGGDTHNNGSTVSTIIFEKNYKLIYKPRSTSGEFAYHKFIDKINPFLKEQMYAIKAIDFNHYGFTEFIEVDNKAEDMYKVGQLAFFMFLLNASDMHYSNVMWTKNGPIPIDLETLFQPDRLRKGLKQSTKNAYHKMEKSVYGTGILPISLSVKGKKGEVDVGFSGIRDERSSSPFRMLEIVDGFTSDIKIGWKKEKKTNSKENLIVDSEQELDILQKATDVVKGFEDASKIFFKKKQEIINIVLEVFENSTIRYIHNMTFRYEQLLRMVTDAEPSKDFELAKLLLARTGILSISSGSDIVLSECKQMWAGDIPYFMCKFSSKKLFDINGVVDEFDITPKQAFLSKAKSITDQEIGFQIKIIKLSFMARLSDPHVSEITLQNKKIILESCNTITQRGDSMGTIKFLSDSLKETVLDDRYTHLPKTWIGPVAREGGLGWSPGVLGYDLYSGRTGPALALAAAGKVLKDKDSLDLAVDIFDKSAQILKGKTYDLRNLFAAGIGAYSGVTGLFWSMHAAGKILNNEEWIKISNQSILLIDESLLKVDKYFYDLISGTSGAIGMMYLTNPNFYLSKYKINEILQVTDRLIKTIDVNKTSGLAHGFSQVLWFLSVMMQRQPSIDIKSRIILVDRKLTEEYTNSNGYIECYYPTDGYSTSTSWCNGISGVLIAYTEAYKAGVVEKARVIQIIKQLNYDHVNFDDIPIMCHGSLGVYESLKYADKYFSDDTSELLKEMRNTSCSLGEIQNYYRKGNGRYPLSPGLMAGQAGALLHSCKMVDDRIKTSPISIQV